MKPFFLLALLFVCSRLTAQGWLWQAGSADKNEFFHLIWSDSDSTVVCVGDSAGRIVQKRFDHGGHLLSSKSLSTISTAGNSQVYTKQDFGYSFLVKVTTPTSWTTFNSYSYYQLNDAEGNGFTGGLQIGHNSNDYVLNDAVLMPDSAVLLAGAHLNPDENKLYLEKRPINVQQPGGWIKELHDSTKNITGMRIFPVSGNRYLVLASRSGNNGSTWFYGMGFLLIDANGDLLESNWVPSSGTFGTNYSQTISHIPIDRDADGFTLIGANTDSIYRFDTLGRRLWTKPFWPNYYKYYPLSVRRTADGFVACGYKETDLEKDLIVTSLDPNGALNWERIYDLRTYEIWNDIIPLPEGGYIAVGEISNPGSTYNHDFFAARINADGSIFNNLLSGYAFLDLNGNCLPDSGETGIGGLNIALSQSAFPYHVLVDSAGHFTLPTDTGQYVLTLSQPPGAYWTTCADSITGYISPLQLVDTVNIAYQPLALCPQMRIDLAVNRIRPCSTATAYLRWQNFGTRAADSAAVVVTLPPEAQLLSADVPLTGLGGGQYLLTLGTVAVGGGGQTALVVQGSCDLAIGDYVCLQARIYPDSICPTPLGVDSSTFQFVQERCMEVRNSFDPNDKTAEPLGRSEFNYIPADTLLTYLIRFQNTGNDTAFQVVVRDTLSAYLDPLSVRVEIASHPCQLVFQADGSLKFVFAQILLPDSTTNEAASHGFVRFQVRLRPGLAPYTAILNRAAIYFDSNTPVLTNTVLRTVQPPLVSAVAIPAAARPVVAITPNPAHAQFTLRITLEQDAAVQVNLYDVAGRPAGRLLPLRNLPAGEYRLDVPAEGWAPGMYFIEIRSEDWRTVKKWVKQ